MGIRKEVSYLAKIYFRYEVFIILQFILASILFFSAIDIFDASQTVESWLNISLFLFMNCIFYIMFRKNMKRYDKAIIFYTCIFGMGLFYIGRWQTFSTIQYQIYGIMIIVNYFIYCILVKTESVTPIK